MGSHSSKSIKFQAFSRFFQGRNYNFPSQNGGMLCCDIVLDFYSVKLPKKMFGIVRNCEDIKFQVVPNFVNFHGKFKVFPVLK